MNSSQAIVPFFKQVELHNGLPFEVKIPPKPPLNMATMTDEEIDAALQVGFDDIAARKCVPLEKAPLQSPQRLTPKTKKAVTPLRRTT